MIPYAIDNPAPSRRGLIFALIGANVLGLVLELAFYPDSMAFAFVPETRTLYSWVTSQFMHAGIGHLLGNMYALYLFGPEIAWRLARWFFPFYLLGGVAANLLHAAAGPFSTIPCIGASGAVAACMGAYVVLFPKARMKFFSAGVGTFTMNPLLFAVVWLLGEGMGVAGAHDGVAHWAHLGGFAFGACAALAMPSEKNAGTLLEEDDEKGRAIRAALAKVDDEAVCALWSAAAAKRPQFALSSDDDQLAAGKALFRAGAAHLAEAALAAAAERSPSARSGAEALLLLGDLELMRFKEFAAAAARYRESGAHPGADGVIRTAAANGLARAQAALTADAPAGAEGSCDVLFEGEPPLTPEQLAAVRETADTSPGPMTGVLASGLAPEAALETARRLEAAGVPAVVLPAARRLNLPAGGQSEEAVFNEFGVTAGPMTLAYDDILLAAAMWVVEFAREDDHGAVGIEVNDYMKQWTGDSAPANKVTVRRHSPRIELVARDGRRLRFDPPDESLVMLREALQAVSLRARRAHLEWGARAVLAGREPLWARFEDAEAADRYVRWQAQLASLKSLSNYGRSA